VIIITNDGFHLLLESRIFSGGVSYPQGKPSSPLPSWLRHWLRLGPAWGTRSHSFPAGGVCGDATEIYHLGPHRQTLPEVRCLHVAQDVYGAPPHARGRTVPRNLPKSIR